MPARVVDEAIKPSESLDGLCNERFNFGNFRNIALNKMRGTFAPRVEFSSEGIALYFIARAKDNGRARVYKTADTTFANAFCAARDNGDFFFVAHKKNNHREQESYDRIYRIHKLAFEKSLSSLSILF